MGEVYLAEHLALQKPVAVKILPPNLTSSEQIDRFLNEARKASRIEHQNVVVIHDVGEQDGLYYIVMQFVQGRNLAELVKAQEGPLPWRSALRLIQLAATGLHAVHDHGLVHRDVKPSNVMLSVDQRVVLMDFGLVREELDSTDARTRHLIGTPPYMSPEQCRGLRLDRRSDIFSLGSTLYYLLAGVAPYRGSLAEVVGRIASGAQPEPVQRHNPDVPKQAVEILHRAMRPDPDERFPTAAVMARELRRTLRTALLADTTTWKTASVGGAHEETRVGEEPRALPAPPRRRPVPEVELLPLQTRREEWQRRLPWITGGAAVVLGLVLLAVVLYMIPWGTNGLYRPPGNTEGMVQIEAGYTHLGDDPAKLRTFLEERLSEEAVESALRMFEREPRKRVHVPAFWIDKYEVTNAQYSAFLKATGRVPPEHFRGLDPPPGKEDHPVVDILYDDAEAYAEWAGKQLPTREQWVRAFRGDHDWLFPWGDDYDPERANVGENDQFPSTSPVTATPRDVSPFDVYNLVGNASEFIRGTVTPDGDPRRVGKGAEYKTRGSVLGVGSSNYYYGLDVKDRGVGFRCVIEEPESSSGSGADP